VSRFAQDVLIEGDILTSDRDEDSGELRINIGDSLTGEGEVIGTSLWAADGFFGRPVDADERGACRVLYHVEGNQQRGVATKDNRFVAAYFELEPGDRAIVTDGSPRFFIKKATHQIALYTEGSGDSGQPMQINLNGDTGTIDISTDDGTDVAQIQIKPNEINIVGGGCCINMKDGKLMLFADFIGINAGKGNLGVVGGVVPPPTSGIIYGINGITGIPSTNWTVAL
jgi:hypothetical protein